MTDINEILRFEELITACDVITSDGEPMTLIQGINYEMAKAAKKSHQFKKQSKLSLVLTLTPGNFNSMNIGASLTLTTPKVEASPMVAYVDSRGNLHGDDPAQQKLFDNTAPLRREVNNND